MKLDYPATGRNREPILAALTALLPERCKVLEIASGSGQHGAWFTRHRPDWTWQPSDPEAAAVQSCAAWRADGGRGLLDPIELDVTSTAWGVDAPDAIFCANMIHIAPWEVALGLLAGARRVLADGGLLVLYGPFRVGGQHTAPSNASFDASLKAQDRRWGVRDLEAVTAAATGFAFERRMELPANNQIVVWRRIDEGGR